MTTPLPFRAPLRFGHALLASALLLGSASVPAAAPAAAAATPATLQNLARTDGFIPFYWDAAKGRVLLEIPVFDADVLYYVSAASGGGSVEMPLDRGILRSVVVHFERAGPKVLVVQQNLDYRAVDGNPGRAGNVSEAFPTSVLASLPVESDANGRVVVDGTSLFIRDAAGLEGQLRNLNQGTFRFDAARSSFYPQRMKAFPDNTEIETVITFAVDAPGIVVRNVSPDDRTFTLRIHHSFLRAPVGYKPRLADPRIGVSGMDFRDYAKPFDENTETAWVTRWRLEKKDPAATLSEPKKPIVFYLDMAIPEPLRSSMRAGILWWNKSFEAAGFRNAIEVLDPTPDMDPMDIRYAWVQWIDRDERGFSSGGTYRDPRTGEILGSKTRMDSHRNRTIANYWEAYMPGTALAGPDMPDGQRDMVVLRQSLLSAHELGHALGFGHNFSSSLNDRASVMEYPTPRVKVVDGKLDLSESFQRSTGLYDDFMARYAYTELPAAGEAAALDAIVAEMRSKGILYVPDTDPRWTWYDDRATPTEYLRETLAARRIMLGQYGLATLEAGEPVGALRDMRMWMAYLHHRWAIESSVKYVGGMYHNIVVKGESLPPTEIVPAALQREVLGLLMDAIEPGNLALPESLLELLTPYPGSNLEDLSTDYAFDQLRAARILSSLVVEPLLEPARAARLVAFADRQPGTVTLPEVVDTLLKHTWQAPKDRDAHHAALRRVTQRASLDAMMMLGGHADTTPDARSFVLDKLHALEQDLAGRKDADPLTQAHYRQSARDIARYLENPAANAPKSASVAWGSRPRSRFPQPPGPPL